MMTSGLEIGMVVATYPQGMSVDVLLDRDGSRLCNVQVMVPFGSDKTGTLDLPDIGGPADDSRWDIRAKRDRYMRAVVGFFRGLPVVLGFLVPQETEITFKDKNRRVMRHASDVYTSIDDNGNVELYHPSGTYLRIGTSGAHEDLTGKDFDGKWQIKRNTNKAVHVHLGVSNAGSEVASLNIDPSGNVNLQNDGNLTADVGGNVTATIAGNTSATIGGTLQATVTGAVTVNAAAGTTVNGPLTVNGLLTFTQGLNGSGGSGATMSIQGNIAIEGDVDVTDGDVTADTISLKGHGHTEQGDGNRTSNSVP